MSRREDVDNAIWGEPPFADLTPHGKLLYLWSFTNSHCNMAGLYKVARKMMALETGLAPRALDAALDELRAVRLAFYERDVLWVRSRVKYLRSRSPMMAKSIASDVAKLDPSDPLRIAFLEKYAGFDWVSETLSAFPSVEPKAETLSGGSIEPLERFQGKGKGTGEETTTVVAPEPEFEEWLLHHEQTTGMRPPKPGTKARQTAAAMFAARRGEDYSPEDLKLATSGAFSDQHRRENGYYGHVSVLRPEKVHDLVEKGRRGGKVRPLTRPPSGYSTCRGCGSELASASDRATGRCVSCDEKLMEGEAA